MDDEGLFTIRSMVFPNMGQKIACLVFVQYRQIFHLKMATNDFHSYNKTHRNTDTDDKNFLKILKS